MSITLKVVDVDRTDDTALRRAVKNAFGSLCEDEGGCKVFWVREALLSDRDKEVSSQALKSAWVRELIGPSNWVGLVPVSPTEAVRWEIREDEFQGAHRLCVTFYRSLKGASLHEFLDFWDGDPPLLPHYKG